MIFIALIIFTRLKYWKYLDVHFRASTKTYNNILYNVIFLHLKKCFLLKPQLPLDELMVTYIISIYSEADHFFKNIGVFILNKYWMNGVL